MSTLVSVRGGFNEAQVLDAFAGSGALGFEALSRGAATATFYEKDAGAVRVLRQNAACLGLGLTEHAIYQGDVFKHHPRFTGKAFDLVFLDPPYDVAFEKILRMLDALHSEAVIAPDAIISYEHARRNDEAYQKGYGVSGWNSIASKAYGDTAIDILQHNV